MIRTCEAASAAPQLKRPLSQLRGADLERKRAAGTDLSRRGRESAPRLNPSQLFEVLPMTSTSVSVAAVAAAPLSAASGSMTKASAIARAAHDLLLHLERGQRIDAPMLRTAMEHAFGASDADGGWDWKTAYDACEAAVRYRLPRRKRVESPSLELVRNLLLGRPLRLDHLLFPFSPSSTRRGHWLICQG
jgi:hypothetical protein